MMKSCKPTLSAKGLFAVAIVLLSLLAAKPASAIVGGQPAKAGEFPYMLSLQRQGWNGGWSHSCGAVLVAPLTAVTAAHCVDGASASSLHIRSHSLKSASGGELTAVTKVVRHPSYNSRTIDNDIAVLHLASLATGVETALLPLPGNDPASGTMTTTAGWGTTRQGSGSISANLMRVDMPVIERATCRNDYSIGDISNNMVCIGGLPEGGKGSCQGDSGGPVMDGATLVGIDSWGYGCAQPNKPDVVTRVGVFVPWILANSLPI